MDSNNEYLSLCEAAVSSAVSQQFANDYVVPDYEAEVMRVIACQSYPYVTGQNITGDRLTVDIGVVHRVIYQSYDMSIHTTSTEETYVKTIELKPGEEYFCAEVNVNEEYSGCKALSKRRLDIKGSLNIGYVVYSKRDYEIPENTNENELRYENISADVLKYAETKTVTIFDSIEDNLSNQNNIEYLCNAEIEDYRIVSGKIVAKGELKYNIIYLDEEMNTETKEFSLPFGQIFDIPGVSEEDRCDIVPTCKNIQFSPEEGQLKTETVISFNIRCFGSLSVDIPVDGYNTKYECNITKKDMPVTDYVKSGEKTVECDVPLGNIDGTAVKVNHICMNSYVRETEKTENGVKVNCMLSGFIMAADDTGTAMGMEKRGEYSFEIETENLNGEKYDISLKMMSLEYALSESGEITVHAEVKAKYSVCTVKKYDILESIEIDENAVKVKNVPAGITVYFAENGESVFDIGKRYNVSVDKLYSENGLNTDILVGKRKILIPIF